VAAMVTRMRCSVTLCGLLELPSLSGRTLL